MAVPPLELPPVEELVGTTPGRAPDDGPLLALVQRVEELDRRLWQVMERALAPSPTLPNTVLPDDPTQDALRFDEV